jgi:hypothetical protein
VRYCGDSQPASVAGRAAAAVAELGKEGAEGKAPRVDGARCALRMRRGDATISVRHDMRYVYGPQTRVATNARCRVPRMGEPPPPRVVSIIIIWTDAAAPMSTSPPGNSMRNEAEGPQTPRHSRKGHATCCRRLRLLIGSDERSSFSYLAQTPRGLNVLYSLEERLVADIAAGGADTWMPGGIQWEREIVLD